MPPWRRILTRNGGTLLSHKRQRGAPVAPSCSAVHGVCGAQPALAA